MKRRAIESRIIRLLRKNRGGARQTRINERSLAGEAFATGAVNLARCAVEARRRSASGELCICTDRFVALRRQANRCRLIVAICLGVMDNTRRTRAVAYSTIDARLDAYHPEVERPRSRHETCGRKLRSASRPVEWAKQEASRWRMKSAIAIALAPPFDPYP